MKHRFAIYSLVVVGAILFVIARGMRDSMAEKAAKDVINDLYSFDSVDSMEINESDLRGRVTTQVFNQLTVDNDERRMNTYLKFRAESSKVKFIKVTDQYVVYSLDCAYIDSSRKFIFIYSIDRSGLISSVYEAELNPFLVGEYEW